MPENKDNEGMARGLGERLGRDLSTQSILLHQMIAEKLGLSGVDHKYLDAIFALSEKGPVTPTDVAAATGLTTGGMTGVLNRLERGGFIRRVPHPNDRRQLLIQPITEKFAEIGAAFAPMQEVWATLCAQYTKEQLDLITGFFEQAVTLMKEANLRMTRQK